MTAKEKQNDLIKTVLKPTLKNYGYENSGQTWWKNKGDFFNVINLQNYSWNSKDSVDFRFNIGIALTESLIDNQKNKAGYKDLTIQIGDGLFVPNERNRKFYTEQGYSITENTNLEELKLEIKLVFESFILPGLDKPNTLQDCVNLYGNITFWGDQLKRKLKEHNVLINK